MTWRFILGIGDGPTDDSLDLNGGSPYTVPRNNGFLAPVPEWGATTRTVEVRVNIEGSDPNALFNAYQELQRKVGPQAREGTGAHRHAEGVVLSMNFGQDEWAYADVISGIAHPPSLRAVLGGLLLDGVLQLTCRRYFRGERVISAPIRISTSSDDEHEIEGVTSGAQVYVPSVAGTAPALARLWLTDTSDNAAVINRVRVGVQALSSGLHQDDVQLVNPFTPLDGIQTDGTGADTYGDAYSTTTAQGEWQPVGRFISPTVLTSGLYDLYLHWRDHASIVTPPTEVMLGQGAIGIVQTVGRFAENVTSIDISWFKPTTPGNLLVLGVQCGNVTITATGWTQAVTVGSSLKNTLYYKADAAQESGQLTISFSGTTDPVVWLTEYSGIAASSPLDVTATNSGSTNAASTGTTSATAQDNALAIALWNSVEPLNPNSLTAGWAYRGQSSIGSTRGTRADRVLTADGAQSASMNQINVETSGWTACIAVFKGATADAPTVSPGAYLARVTAITADGESLASFPAGITLSATGAINVRWEAPTVGTVTGYRVYLSDGSDWYYWDTGSTATNYSIVALETPDGTSAPPTSSSLRSEVRLRIGVGSGRVLRPTRARYSQLANGLWEHTYMDTVELPPEAAGEGEPERGYTVEVQVRNTANPNDVDVDAAILRPHNGAAVDAHYSDDDGVPMTLDENLIWVLDTRRDERTSAVLRDESGDAAGLWASGGLALYPGDNVLLLLLESTGGVSDIENLEATVRVDYTPRWGWLPGQDWG